MKKSNLAVLMLFFSAAAFSADELAKSDLIGTWEADEETTPRVEVFLADGSYCSYATPTSEHPYSRGTWTLGTYGSVVLNLTASEDPSDLNHLDLGQIRRARLAPHNHLLLGLSCEHCQGGILGSSYEHAEPQRQSCSG